MWALGISGHEHVYIQYDQLLQSLEALPAWQQQRLYQDNQRVILPRARM